MSAVPRLDVLCCPLCGRGLGAGEAGSARSARCEHGHCFDIARQGYVSLVTGAGVRGDTAAMVRARTSFLASGVYEPIAREVAEVIGDHVLPPPAELRDETPAGRPARVATGPLLADLGGGTGYYSAYVLNHVPEFEGVLLDASAPAAKVAVRAHPRLTVATADLWRAIPLPTANVDVALVVFAPRNPAEIARILKSDGICVVATPQPDHLAELRAVVPLLGIEPDKGTRLESQFAGFGRFETRFVTYQTALDPTAIAEVIGMGPSAYHLSPANIADRAAAAGRRLVTVSVAVDVFTRGA